MAALLVGASEAGLLAELIPFVATCIALTGFSLLAVGRDLRLNLAAPRRTSPPWSRFRRSRPPEEQLRRDQWLRPLPAAGLLFAVESALVAADQMIGFPDKGLYWGSCLVFGFLFSYVALRPLGCNLFTPYTESTGFSAAWNVLPVRREAVIRGVYVHGLVAGVGIFAGIFGVAFVTTWLDTGTAAFVDFHGDPAGEAFYPLIALVPCLAGGLTSAAAGDRLLGFICLAAGTCVLMGHFLLLILEAPAWFHSAVLIALALCGGVPPLRHLGKPVGLLENESGG